jgi:ribonuclease BN (tRNA processing enzyme)
MSRFEVIVLGVGDAFSERYNAASLLLVCDGFHMAIDCPDRYRAVLASTATRCGRELSLSDIDHMLVTHVHGDHMNGLEGVAFYKRFYEDKRLRLVASPEVGEVIWTRRLAVSMGTLITDQGRRRMTFEDYFEYIPLNWTKEIVVGPYRIQAYRTLHHVPTSALLIETDSKILGYSSDTAFDPELIRFLEHADIIIHETNLGTAHTTYAELVALPVHVRAKMRLIHYPDTFNIATSVINVLREGEIICL